MNELSEPDPKSIRTACAQLDPVPENVLAAARGALGHGLPTTPRFSHQPPSAGESDSPNRR